MHTYFIFLYVRILPTRADCETLRRACASRLKSVINVTNRVRLQYCVLHIFMYVCAARIRTRYYVITIICIICIPLKIP